MVGAERCRGLVVLECDIERVPKQCDRLVLATARDEDHGLRGESLRQDFRQRERLGELEGLLDPLERESDIPREEHEAAELGGERCEVFVGLFLRKHLERAVHVLQAELEAAPVPQHLGQPSRHPGRRVRCVRPFEEADRRLVVRGRGLRSGPSSQPARAAPP